MEPGASDANPGFYGGFIELDGDLYFTATDPTNGYEPRIYDPETGSVTLLEDIYPGSEGSFAGFYGDYFKSDGKLYFTAFDQDNLYALRSYDPKTEVLDTVDLGPGGTDAGRYGGFFTDPDLFIG